MKNLKNVNIFFFNNLQKKTIESREEYREISQYDARCENAKQISWQQRD